MCEPVPVALELYDRLQADERTREVPVLLLCDTCERQTLQERRVTACVARSTDMDGLLSRIVQLVDTGGREAPIPEYTADYAH